MGHKLLLGVVLLGLLALPVQAGDSDPAPCLAWGVSGWFALDTAEQLRDAALALDYVTTARVDGTAWREPLAKGYLINERATVTVYCALDVPPDVVAAAVWDGVR